MHLMTTGVSRAAVDAKWGGYDSEKTRFEGRFSWHVGCERKGCIIDLYNAARSLYFSVGRIDMDGRCLGLVVI
jgi:hypothetical protein